ncbi:Fc.00g010310.m01.CDS01 [Cosmosporella sp. VM-42]
MSTPATKWPVALFPGFQALDVFGPLDTLNVMSKRQPLTLSLLHTSLEPVSTLADETPGRIGQSIVPTHTYDTAPEDIEVLLVPGGMGNRNEKNVLRVREFYKERYPKLRYLLTVCTGSAIAAQSGALDGKEATSNKRSFAWVQSQGPNVKWIREARWVVDGNIWTSSGITAGIDMIYAFIAEHYGQEIADDTANGSEYVRSTDPKIDTFAKFVT